MKNKKIICIIAVLILITITIYFFSKNNYKTTEFGNTNIKSAEDIKEYILNLESYEAQISIEINSNKNQNQYKIKQIYKAPNLVRSEVLEPQSIRGVVTTYDGNNLKIENTKLNLSKIYENYPYVTENHLWLSDFINRYKNNPNATFEEKENQIIMKTNIQDNVLQTLYIDTKTKKPIKLTLEDMNQKMLVYILYNEIKINSSR